MTRLHTAVPAARLRGMPQRLWGLTEAVAALREAYATMLLPGNLDHEPEPAG